MKFASAFTCASAPARGGSSTTASKRFNSSGVSGSLNRSRFSVVTGLRPLVLARRLRQSRQGFAILLDRMDLGAPRQRQGESSHAGKQIGDRFGAVGQGQHAGLQRGFALRGRLQEDVRRQRNGDAIES